MPQCCVPGCNSTRDKDPELSFHRLPADSRRRREWLRRIRREKEFTPTCHTRVCSRHFVAGTQEGPQLFPWNAQKLFQPTPHQDKRRRTGQGNRVSSTTLPLQHYVDELPADVINPLEVLADVAVSAGEMSDMQTFHRECSHSAGSPSSALVVMENENVKLKGEVSYLQAALQAAKQQSFLFRNIQDDNEKVAFFSGLPDKDTFFVVRDLLCRFPLQYHSSWTVNSDTIDISEQLLLTLMKLRLGLKNLHLATHFNISTATVSNIFITLVSALYDVLYVGIMHHTVPSQTKNAQCLPLCFAQFPNCRMIIDCTEISVDKAENLKLRCTTYSNYKSKTTLKALVGVAPNGVLVYVSDLYGGSISDKQIVVNCDLFSYLQAGDMIMADKGFNIRQILPSGITLNMPSFLYNGQFSKEEVVSNKAIASARIHVERAIQRIKQFLILDHIPASLRQHADKIFKVCACLTNFQSPILAEMETTFHLGSDATVVLT